MAPARQNWCKMRARHNILIDLARDLGSTRDLRLRSPSVDTCLLSRSLSKMLLQPQEKPMATTCTPGITVLADGRRFIDKRYLGVRIGMRVGAVTQEQAEERLEVELVECNATSRERRMRVRPLPIAPRVISRSRTVSAASTSLSGMSCCSISCATAALASLPYLAPLSRTDLRDSHAQLLDTTMASCDARHHAVCRGDIFHSILAAAWPSPARDRHAGSLRDASEGSFLHDKPVAKATTLTTPNTTKLAAMI